MVRNTEKLDLATQYRKRGYSYSEIAKICGVSKGTLSNWFAKKAFSKRVMAENTARSGRANAKRLQLINKARQKDRIRTYDTALKVADTEYRHYRHNPLFMAGLMLYLADGDRSPSPTIRLSTTSIPVHTLFRRFAKQFLTVHSEDIRFWLLLYPQQSESDCVKIWSKNLKVRPEQWYKNQKIASRSTKEALHFGVGNTIIGSTLLKKKLLYWIEKATKELAK
jgi:transposase-like protein